MITVMQNNAEQTTTQHNVKTDTTTVKTQELLTHNTDNKAHRQESAKIVQL